jgi:hypothetical protein
VIFKEAGPLASIQTGAQETQVSGSYVCIWWEKVTRSPTRCSSRKMRVSVGKAVLLFARTWSATREEMQGGGRLMFACASSLFGGTAWRRGRVGLGLCVCVCVCVCEQESERERERERERKRERARERERERE